MAFVQDVLAQGTTCATATLLTTNSTATCTNYTSTAATGSSVCTGGGFGGSGFLSWFRFCTDANASCIELNLTPGTLTGAYSYGLYATCGGGLVPGQIGSNNCFSNGGSSTWRTTGLNLAPNTCYYLAVWTKNAGTFQICSKKIPAPPNDECAGATQITSAPAPANNYCYTPNVNDPAPATFCALSDENSSWFVFTAQCNGSVTLNITNITCTGGAGGFQIGFYTGSCNNLTNIGCNSGSGGTVTTTVTGLTAGQTVYILIDGNAGSQCTFNVSATNTTPAVSPPVTICRGQSATLTAYGGGTYAWSPGGQTTQAITVSPTTTTTYTVVVNNCAATTLTTTVNVTQPVTPTFTQVAPICVGGTFTLPTTSNNGVTGTWSPAINNQATTTYTFTPAAGECATTATMTVTVGPASTPTFNTIAPICRGGSFTLPTTSLNGFTGTWSPAINNTQTTTYTFTPTAGLCATITTLTVTVNQPVTPTFNAIAPICAGGTFTLPATSVNGINGTWSPALNNQATTTYTFTPAAGQCANIATLTVTVNQPVVPAFAQVGPICSGNSFSLPASSTNGITGTWSPAINNQATTTYTFTPSAGLCATTATMTVTVNPLLTPAFNPIAPICAGGSFTLPNSSTNGINGAWSPAINNQATTIYTFTPAAGSCATTTMLTVVVNPSTTPTFNQVAAICRGGSFTLPASSNEGITGTWSPAINNQSTTTYTFTPSGSVCATTATMTVTVNQPVTPSFTQVPAICNGGSFALPGTSNNGITGSWSPAINNSQTTTYTFTPTAGLCASVTTMTVTVNQPLTPLFNAIAPICAGGSFSLSNTSTNGITGSWSPAINNQVTTTYNFTPAPGACANPATITVTVNQPVTPLFNPPAALCAGASFALPSSSTNGISGTWSPAFNNQLTGTYTFTPNAGACATTTTMTVTIDQPVTPTFTPVSAICSGGSLTLPATSNNGITGSWSPAVNNTQTTTYTFTPSAGQCATATTMTVTVSNTITPAFTPEGPLCFGSTAPVLPNTSLNGITGTWTPAVSNTNSGTYTFTPDPGQCASSAVTMDITVVNPVTPGFSAIGPVCNGSSFTLPVVSNNGISGSWSPGINNSQTTTYTFSPAAGECATPTTLTVVVNDPVTPSFVQVANICAGGSFTLPTTSTNGIQGSWSPGINTNATTVYTFTPAAGACATTAQMTVAVDQPVTPAFNPIPSICSGSAFSLAGTSLNGISGTWTPAINNTQTTTYTFTPAAGACATTAQLTVAVDPKLIPSFTPVAPICNGGSFTLQQTSNNGISGSWSPAVNNTQTTIYTFTPAQGVCADPVTLTVTVNQPQDPTFNPVGPICSGGSFSLPSTSLNGFTGSWSPAIDNSSTTTYTFTPVAGACANTTTMTVAVNVPVDPTFSQVGPVCSGTSFTLPNNSSNGVSGSWSPNINNTATTTYTFTPAAGLCANTAQMTVVVDNPVAPTFDPITPICRGGSFSLPALSTNGISGSWTPSINNTQTTTYTFAPVPGSCALPGSLTVTVNQPDLPVFTPVSAICSGGSFSLPPTSDNGIVGTWTPAINNTQTTTYSFTPAAGLCASSTTMTVTVIQPVVPAFNPPAAICFGQSFALPTTSVDGISGTWSPFPDNTQTTTYTFTPAAGSCALQANMTVVVNTPVDPLFNQVPAICAGGSFTLPSSSLNGIPGTWSPPVNNQLTTTYTFTPSSSACANNAQMTVTVNSPAPPVFAPIGAICIGSSLTLPGTSIDGITGSWSPAINNTQTTTYTFTPNAGQCATATTMTVDVTSAITPSFAQPAPVCSGTSINPLPATSLNGITGAWSPAFNNSSTTTYTFTPDPGQCANGAVSLTVVVNQPAIPVFNTAGPICSGGTVVLPSASNDGFTGSWSPAVNNTQTTTYTFTPDPGQCAAPANMTVVVNQPVTPGFTAIGPICSGTAFSLPSISNDGIPGSWSPVPDFTQTTTYTFTPANSSCALPTTMTVVVNQPITPSFNPIGPLCEGSSFTLPSASIENITGTWSPSINNMQTTTYAFTPSQGQCANAALFTVVINPPGASDFTQVTPICRGGVFTLPAVSNNGISGSWSPAINNLNTTSYTFTPASGSCALPAIMTVVVNQPVNPTFAPVGPVCKGDNFSLPSLSNEGISGTWNPAINNQLTTVYTFTPSSGECAVSSQLTVVVNSPIIPNFAQEPPICYGGSITLPATSPEGIVGTWSPAINNQATTTYTFTPNAGFCASNTAMTVVVNQPVVPDFNSYGPFCQNAILAQVMLPTTSNNGITGTWNPGMLSTAVAGNIPYGFTPDAGQCASTFNMIVQVNPEVVPSFDVIDPVCRGGVIQLQTTSNEGISGTWSPAVNNQVTTSYTFTPAAGLCATSFQMTVQVNAPVDPVFTPVTPICQGGSFSLPAVSNNAIPGIWSPAINNQSTTTYTFTPPANACANTAQMTVVVNPPAPAAFTPIGSICTGSSFTLPSVSIDGITGSWSPQINNTQTTTYTFTPDPNQCALPATMTVSVSSTITPTFDPVGPYCSGSQVPALPLNSLNGITGTWIPSVINNTQTTNYVFTPDPNQCANAQVNLTVNINSPVTPAFSPVAPICQGGAFNLPLLSNDGISGTWSPAINNQATTTYSFTPDPNQCALSTQLTVAVGPPATPTFTQPPSVCQGAAINLPAMSNEGISGTWTPVPNSNVTTTYTFTPVAGACATAAQMTVQVDAPVLATFNPVAPICSGASFVLPAVSNEGISGSWSPAINNAATTNYVFTPVSGACATGNNLTVIVNQPVNPTFNPIAAICAGSPLTLPSSSNEGITGAWTPAVNNTTTTQYIFNPDPNQCAASGALMVVVNALPSAPALNLVQPTCSTSAVLTVTGVAGELYSLDNGPFSPNLVFNSLSTGNHTLVSQNAAGCISAAASVTVNAVPGTPASPQVAAVQPDCVTATGSIQISGVPGETYSLDGSPYVSTVSYSGMAPGNHTVIAQNATGCISSPVNIIINQAPAVPAQPVLTAFQPDCSNPNASIQITGVAGETYSFDGGPFTAVLLYSNVTSGNHTVVAQNAGGCVSASASVIINAASAIPIAPGVNPVQPTCTVNSGSLTIVGVAGETYSVNGGAYSGNLNYTGLAPGNYTVIAQNSIGCISPATLIQINQPPAPPAAPVAVTTQPDCNIPTGSILISGVGGQTYSINGGAFGSTLSYSSLAPGIYSILTQTDPGCISAVTQAVINPAPPVPVAPALTPVQPTCTVATGSLQINGLPGEAYSLNGGAFSANLNYSTLAPGIYSVIAENGSGCRSTAASVTINAAPPVPSAPAVSAIQPSCTIASAINISAAAGLVYSLDGGPFSSAAQYSPLTTGTHSVVAQNSFGCISPATSIVIDPVPGAPAPPSVSATQPTCTVATGSAIITGAPGLTYSFNGGSFSATLNYSPLSPGTYPVTARDAAGCISAPYLVTIDVPPAIPPAPAVTSPVRICQYAAGQALTASGTGQLIWYTAASGGAGSNNAPVPSTANLGLSYYYVSQVVGPCEGPRTMIMVRIEAKPVLDIDRDLRLCFGKTLDLTSLYNTSGLASTWTFNAQPVPNPASVNTSGLYELIVSNSAGCRDTARVRLTMQPGLIANAGPDDTVQFYTPYQLQGSGGGSYMWTPGSPILNNAYVANPIALIRDDTQFILTVTDDIGCSDTDTMWLRVLLGEDFQVPNAFTPNGDGLNDIFRPTPMGGILELDYFAVYNRYGNLVFQTSDVTRGWDGNYAGRPQDPGNFVWVLKGKNRRGEYKFLKGNVVLIR